MYGGYDDNNFFHFNWGWGGVHNGYFTVNALNPPGTGIGGGSRVQRRPRGHHRHPASGYIGHLRHGLVRLRIALCIHAGVWAGLRRVYQHREQRH
ncbi:MAG: hypothetical protein IPH05_17355 [Flavobacteriales bacterium]|nr:hypothetical protein [Flavobacteriales bacterium]